MKAFTSNGAIALLDPSQDLVKRGVETFEATPIYFDEKGEHLKSIIAGHCNASCIGINGKPVYLVIWRQTVDGDLWIELLQKVAPEEVAPECCSQGIEQLAKAIGAKTVRCLVKSPAVARLYERVNFEAYAVAMKRSVSYNQN